MADDSVKIELPERMDSSEARDLLTQIKAHSGADIELDGKNVSHVGGLCLQVLIKAKDEWTEQNHSLFIGSPSDALSGFLNMIDRSDLILPEAS